MYVRDFSPQSVKEMRRANLTEIPNVVKPKENTAVSVNGTSKSDKVTPSQETSVKPSVITEPVRRSNRVRKPVVKLDL